MAADFEMVIDRGNREVLLRASQMRQLTERSIRHGWFALGRDLRTTANTEILRRPKSGRTYYRRDRIGRRRRHIASAPGETHANMTGAARRSLGWIVRGFRSLEFGYGVSTREPAPPYVPALELGSTRMAPRPSLQNAIEATNRNAELYFTERFNP